MKLLLAKSDIVALQKIKKVNLSLIAILSFIFLAFFLNLQLNKSNVNLKPANIQGIVTNSNAQTINSIYVVVPWLLITAVIFISLFQLGILTASVPKSLSEIVSSDKFKIQSIDTEINNEIGILNLPGALIEIRWEKVSGQFQNWKLLLSIKILDETKIKTFSHLSRLLLMENHPDNKLSYTKNLFIKDWPKQEYLIDYWLKDLINV